MISGPLDESGYPRYIEFSERATKCRGSGSGSHSVREDAGRCYLDLEHPEICPVRTILAYRARKTEHQLEPSAPFLLGVYQTAEKNPEKHKYWYIDVPMGINTISKLYKSAFEEMNVDTKALKITATSCRKNLAQCASEAEVPGSVISKMMGHAMPETKYNYLKNREHSREAAAKATSRRAMGNTSSTFSDLVKEVTKKNKSVEPSVTVDSDTDEEVVEKPLKPKVKPSADLATPGPSNAPPPGFNMGPSTSQMPMMTAPMMMNPQQPFVGFQSPAQFAGYSPQPLMIGGYPQQNMGYFPPPTISPGYPQPGQMMFGPQPQQPSHQGPQMNSPQAVMAFQQSSIMGAGFSQQQKTGFYNGPGFSNFQQQVAMRMPLMDITNTGGNRPSIEGPKKKVKSNPPIVIDDEIDN